MRSHFNLNILLFMKLKKYLVFIGLAKCQVVTNKNNKFFVSISGFNQMFSHTMNLKLWPFPSDVCNKGSSVIPTLMLVSLRSNAHCRQWNGPLVPLSDSGEPSSPPQQCVYMQVCPASSWLGIQVYMTNPETSKRYATYFIRFLFSEI